MFENGFYKRGYRATILADKTTVMNINDQTYVAIPNRSSYKIQLENKNKSTCGVVIYFDKVKIGAWKIEPYGIAFISRPTWINKKFMFGDKGQLRITIEFYPEEAQETGWSSPTGCNEKTVRYFGDKIVLDGYSDNSVKYSKQWYDTKIDNKVIISIIMLVDNHYDKPYITTEEQEYNAYFDRNITPTEIKAIPKVRIYEDFFMLPRIRWF